MQADMMIADSKNTKEERANMNEMMKLENVGEYPVSGRELHERLGIGTQYKDWFPRMCEYGFEVGVDFNTLKKERVQIEGAREVTREVADHNLTLSMAKEIAMLQRTDKGREVRRYLIQVEEAWNSPEMTMARALQFAGEQVKKLEGNIFHLEGEVAKRDQLIGELKPKADYVDWILKNPGLVTITQIAKDYGMSGRALNQVLNKLGIQYKQSGQWLLYHKYHGMGYTHSETIAFTRSDGREDTTMETKWTQKGRLFIYEMLKEKEGLLPMIERALTA